MRPNSVSVSPSRPLVTAPTGCTSHRPTCWPLCQMASEITGESFTGVVFAMANTAVNPPRAAAREPVSMVSASSPPGSRRCTCMSTRPGRSTAPLPSSVESAWASAPALTEAITPFSTSTLTGSPSP